MTYPHRAPADPAPQVTSSVAKITGPKDWAPRSERRPLRAMPLARRYEVAFQRPDGGVGTVSRLAPALPLFEQAFSAVARGTVIATPNGPTAVEDLMPGDLVTTLENGPEELLWTGTITLYPVATTERTGGHSGEPARLTRIMADSYGLGRPLTDVVLGPHARVLRRDPRLPSLVGAEQAYAPVRAMADGESVIEVTPATPVSVHHLVLAQQRTLSAAGVDIESFHPGEGFEGMMDRQLLQLFLALFPHLPQGDERQRLRGFGPVAHPRLTRFEAEELQLAR